MRRLIITLALLLACSWAFGATLTVGPGKDHATITAAIHAAANDDTIAVYTGTYTEKGSNNAVYVNKRLAFTTPDGIGTVTVKADDAGIRVVQVHADSGGSVSWTGFVFDATLSTTALRSICIDVGAVANVDFTNCTFKGASTLVQYASGTTGHALTGCTFTDEGRNITVGLTAGDNTITLDTCLFTFTGATTARGIRLFNTGTNGKTLTVSGCTFGTSSAPFICTSHVVGSEGSLNVTIDGCTGYFGAGVDSIFSHNIAASTGVDTIRGNTFTISAASGASPICINAGAHAPVICRNTLTHTAADNNQTLIYLRDQAGALVADNTIQDATVDNTYAAICITTSAADKSSANAIIRNNTIRRPAAKNGYCILVGSDSHDPGAATATCGGAIIEYNRIYGLVSYGAAVDQNNIIHGIEIGWNTAAAIRYNYVNGCGYGIIAKAGGDAPQDWAACEPIRNNIIVNCYVAGLYAKAVSNTAWEHNTVCITTAGVLAGGACMHVGPNTHAPDGLGDSAGTSIKHNIFYCSATTMAIKIAAGQGVTTITDNCCWQPGAIGTTDWFVLDGNDATWAEFTASGAHPSTGINSNPRFAIPGKDFRLLSTSPCINPGSTARLTMRSERLYIPQYAWGALAPAYEPLKPIE